MLHREPTAAKRSLEFSERQSKEVTPTKRFVDDRNLAVSAPSKAPFASKLSRPAESRQQLVYNRDSVPAADDIKAVVKVHNQTNTL